MSEEVTKYTPLTQEAIDEIISHSRYSEKLKPYINNHFLGLDRPTSVSIGITTKDSQTISKDATEKKFSNEDVSALQKIYKSQGIDIVDTSSEACSDPNKFIIDQSGIQTPFLSPEEALRATVDIYDIQKQSGVSEVGFILPKTKGSLCKSSNFTGRVIDINDEIKNNPQSQKMLNDRGISADEFIAKQLEESQQLPSIDVSSKYAEGTSIYRGEL